MVTPSIRAIRLLSIGAVPYACACSADTSIPVYTVRDSLGIEIVETGPPIDDVARVWTISASPSLQIGMQEGGDPYVFTQLWDAARAPDGRTIAVEGVGREIRIFGPDGDHLVTFGGPGDGPREFGGPPWISLRVPDTLVVWDPGHFRLSSYTLSGTLIGQTSMVHLVGQLSIGAGYNARVWQTTPDGSVLWTGPERQRPAAGLMDQAARSVLIRGTSKLSRDFGSYPSGQTFFRRVDRMFIGLTSRFAPHASVVLGPAPNRVTISDPEHWELRSFDGDGVLHRITRAHIARNPVTSELVGRERAKLPEYAQGMGIPLGEAESMFDGLPLPDSLVAVRGLMWDQDGNLWASSSTSELDDVDSYHVFGPDGRWLAMVEMPEGIGRVFEVGDDYVLASWQDESDVQYLRMYPLEKG